MKQEKRWIIHNKCPSLIFLPNPSSTSFVCPSPPPHHPLQHFEDVLKHKQLELQLCEAKLAQQMVAIAETKESNMAERQYVSHTHLAAKTWLINRSLL